MSESTAQPWVSVSAWTGGRAAPRRPTQAEIEEPGRWLRRNEHALFPLVRHLPVGERGIAIQGQDYNHNILAIGRFGEMPKFDGPVFLDYIRDPTEEHVYRV